MIKFENVTSVYRNGSGIFNLSFEIKSSDLVFLMGPTGSGKSTVLKTIYRELDIDNGKIFIDNQDINQYGNNKLYILRRSIGMIFQDFRLLNDRSIYDNVALPLLIENYSKRDIKDKVYDILNVVGLNSKEKRYPDELSGGEQQRVSIARAIIKDPKILLADEPTGNLDPNISMEILELLEMASDNGATVIMCTHNYPLIKYKKRRFLELKDGRIQ
ncbi:MAG: cell division ATP-binding protein FtsE [Candidatus Marinimicrobia bacterium]|nr:cell division ATP-binding protein FtsE [Candidatus Neomarinimicrobiota bacterium]|tara:strand:- start:2036 stop:2683 length:648 start_codon:yes stop_codon:yes gene_type:complete